MAQGARQSSLFAAEDFSVVYESFSQANFQAYDFDTIRSAMVDYVRANYPEDFNDWISSSEFVSLIELMAFLGHNLAFRADLASRENYLSTAERRESALRIAEFLGYEPTRNVVADGYLKINSIKTSERLYDAEGSSLANKDIFFEDVTNPDTYQDFLTIMNSIFTTSNQFGTPFAKFNQSGVVNEVYKTSTANNSVVESFNSTISGQSLGFELYSVYYNQNVNVIEERTPEPNKSIDILYKNDNSGFTSPNTGFFMGFKQGTLNFQDFNVDTGLANLVLDVTGTNIANGNIWVQTIGLDGTISTNWTLVDRQYGTNAIYNSVSNNQRDIFTVSSREDDQISIVFGDGSFANIPRGIIRVWYRTGANLNYVINPNNMSSITKNFRYTGIDGNEYTATINLGLKETVSNASIRESLKSIKDNAGRFYSAQDRMVTADDYSLFPLTVSENVSKIKSINRVHSGHSRFRDFYDPTATYSDASMYMDDGYLYKDDATVRSLIGLPSSLTSEQIFNRHVAPLLNDPELTNFYFHRQFYGTNISLDGAVPGLYDAYQHYSNTTGLINFYNVNGSIDDVYRWNQITSGNSSSTGYITLNGVVQNFGTAAAAPLDKLSENGLVEFITSPFVEGYISRIELVNQGSGYTSAPTISIDGIGTGATAEATLTGDSISSISVTAAGSEYNSATNITITGGGGSGGVAKVYVTSADTKWVKIVSLGNNGLGEDSASGIPTGITLDSRGSVALGGVVPTGARIKRIVPTYSMDTTTAVKAEIKNAIDNRNSFGLRYDIPTRGWALVASGDLPGNSIASTDVSSWSRQFEGDITAGSLDQSWIIRFDYSSTDWEILVRKTRFVFGSDTTVRFNNLNFEETFSSATSKPRRDNLEVLDINNVSSSDYTPLGKKYKFNVSGYYKYSDGYTDNHKVKVTLADPDNDNYPDTPDAFQQVVRDQTINLGTITENGYDYTVRAATGTNTGGREAIHTRYNRIADLNQVIDPSRTNIIDTYVLLRSYDTEFRTWAAYDGRSFTQPAAPTVNGLSKLFTSLSTKKTISDQIIYRPVKYKILFGDLASSELQANFKITKTVNSTLSDTEIKQTVVQLINEYFSIDNWDFGETFYFTELASYVHNNLIGQISQINIVPIDNRFGSTLYEINSQSDELFLPVLTSANVIVESSNNANLTTITSNSGVN